MRKSKGIIMVLLSLVVCMCMSVSAMADDGNDTTAPRVESAKFLTTSVDKPTEDGVAENIQLNLSVIEEETGISRVKLAIYTYKEGNIRPMVIYAEANYPEATYTGDIVLDIPYSKSDAAGVYLLGSVEVTDNAGNVARYFDQYYPEGYRKDSDDNEYLILYGEDDVTKGCYIDATAPTVEIKSNGDDTAPIITSARIVNTSVTRPGTVTVELDVVEESGIDYAEVTYMGKKGEQDILIGNGNAWFDVTGNTVRVHMPVEEYETAGKYYIEGLLITDTQGNTRHYIFDYFTYTYYTDDEGQYVLDEGNDNVKCYIENAETVTVESNGDDVAPVISNVTLDKYTVKKPGVLGMTLKLKEADEVKSVTVKLRKSNGTEQDWINYYKQYTEKVKSDTVQVNFPIATATEEGEYYIEEIMIADFSGNKREYYYDRFDIENGYYTSDNKPYIADRYDENIMMYLEKNQSVKLENEFPVKFELALSNPNLMTMINDMATGENGKVYIDGDGIAKAEIFESIKGKDVTIVFYKDNYQWIFNGKDVTAAKDVDLNVNFYLINGLEYDIDGTLLKIVFPENGELPGKTNVRIKSDYTYDLYNVSEAMYLYYVNEDVNTLEYQEESDIAYLLDGTDHWCKFDITHNSTYVVYNEKLDNQVVPDYNEGGSDEDMNADDKVDEDIKDETPGELDEVPSTGDGNTIGLYMVLLSVSIVGMLYGVKKKRYI